MTEGVVEGAVPEPGSPVSSTEGEAEGSTAVAGAEGAPGGSGPGRKPTLRERVEALPYFYEIQARLIRGESLTSTAKLIRRLGDLPNVNEVKLVQALDRIRAKLPRAPAVSLARQAGTTPAEVLKEIAYMERLFAQQLRRIAMDHRLEKKLNKALPSVGREIDLAFRLRQGIQQLKVDVGLLKKVPFDYGVPPPPPLPAWMPKTPQERARVREAVKRFVLWAKDRKSDEDVAGGAAALPAPGDGGPDGSPPPGGTVCRSEGTPIDNHEIAEGRRE